MNNLSSSVLNKDIFPSYRPPAEYTGEKFGVEYLYAQLGAPTMDPTDKCIDDGVEKVELDEGFGDSEEISDEILDDVAVALPSELQEDEDEVSASLWTWACCTCSTAWYTMCNV